MRVVRRGRWLELAAAAILVGAWSVHTYVGPGIAAIYWDRFRRASVADSQVSQELFAKFAAGKGMAPNEMRRSLSQTILRHLQSVIYWDPNFARAHTQLADRSMAEFELRVGHSANVLEVRQIRDAALVSSFDSSEDLHAWMDRAFGPDVNLLREARAHARRAVELCPLEGSAYLHLADLAFLELGKRAAVDAYVDQALRLRPFDRGVLADAGVQSLLLGDVERAFACWTRCFNTPGSHQQRIIYRLVVSGMPANEFLARLQPDWRTLRAIWAQYRKSGQPQDLTDLLSYAANETQREAAHSGGSRPAYVWFWQSQLYADLGRRDEVLVCLERAYACDPRKYPIRHELATALLNAGRFAEAEPHVRWCLARRPADKALNAALPAISKHRMAQRGAVNSTHNAMNAATRPTSYSVNGGPARP